MDAKSLVYQQIQLEYNLDADGRLVPIAGSTEKARYVVHLFRGGCLRFYRQDLPLAVRNRLAALPAETSFVESSAIEAILAIHEVCSGSFFGVSGVFTAAPDRAQFPDVSRTKEGFVVLEGRVEAAIAWSVRENAGAAEVAVETREAYRRRGYARQVAAAWAHHVLKQGKTAFYSYAEENLASRALANALGVVEFSRVAAYD